MVSVNMWKLKVKISKNLNLKKKKVNEWKYNKLFINLDRFSRVKKKILNLEFSYRFFVGRKKKIIAILG